MKKYLFLTAIVLLFWSPLQIQAQTQAVSILKKMDQVVFAPKDKQAKVEMVLVNFNSAKIKTKEAMLYQKGADTKLFRFTAPKSEAGISSLSLPGGVVYLYMPMFNKPKKMTSIANSRTFNPSDFSVEDMATKPYAEKYKPVLVKTTDTSYVLKLIPKATDASYIYLLATINKKYYYPEKIEFFNLERKREKISDYFYIKIGYYWVPREVDMTDLIRGHKTKIIMTDIKLNQNLPDSMFTPENMVPKPAN